MSEIKLNPKLDLDLPFDPNSPAETVNSPIQLNSFADNTSPVSNTSQNIETVPVTAPPIYAQPLEENATVEAPVVTSSTDPTKQIDVVMIVSFLLFLISLGAAGYFLYQYFK